jgi:uncharacterized membrane protein YjjP (DUF1212 family)
MITGPMEEPMTERSAAFDEACSFLIKLGTAAHRYGSTGSRIESYLAHLSAELGYHGTFRVAPTEILFAFSRDRESPQRLELEDVPPSGWDLNRLAALGDLASEVEAGELSIPEATSQIDRIAQLPDPWNSFTVGSAMSTAGAGFATMIGGSVWDVIAGGVLGLVVFFVVGLVGRLGGRLAIEWTSFLAALVVGVLVALARIIQPDINPIVVAVCALVILVPGYPISLGVLELLSNHVVSGLANLMNGFVTLAQLVAGAWLGYALIAEIAAVPEIIAGRSVGLIWLLIAVVPMLAALCVAMQSPRQDTVATMAIVGLAFAVNFFVGAAVAAMAGVFLATLSAMVVGMISANLWNRRTGRPTTVMTAQIAMLLTSGTIGFRGLAAITTGQAALGVEQLGQMFVVALALGVGLVVGNGIVQPRVSL